jgi:hypothetical protein
MLAEVYEKYFVPKPELQFAICGVQIAVCDV